MGAGVRAGVAALGAAVLLAAPVVWATPADTTDLHPWARFKPGAFVRIEGGKPGERVTFLSTLKSAGDGFYEIEHVIDPQRPDARPKLERHRVGELVPAIDSQSSKEGEETVKIKGRAIGCTVWRWTGRRDANTSLDVRECRAPGIPIPLKQTIKTLVYGLPVLESYVATRLDETVKVAGHTFKTVRLEGTTEIGGKPIVITRWVTLDVPGGYVRETRAENGKVFASSEVTAFKP